VQTPKLEFAVADEVADQKLKFFSPAQFAALKRLGGILMPQVDDAPGALEARAAEFLDFLSPT
jgi:hypothetical protein